MNREKVIMNICFILKDGKVLLGMKKRGFGAGQWNGFGGKINPGETIEEGVKRETQEESGVIISDLEKVGIVNFYFSGKSKYPKVHVFKTSSFSKEPVETEEMRPQWFDIKNIPFDQMWPDDEYWLPLLLDGKKFQGEFYLDIPSSPTERSKILKYSLNEVENVD